MTLPGIIAYPGVSALNWLNSTSVPAFSTTVVTNNSQCTAVQLFLSNGSLGDGAFSQSGANIRIQLSPQNDIGSQVISNMYMGCQSTTAGQSACSYDGAQVPITFSGATSTTLISGTPQFSDKFTLIGADSSVQIDGTRTILCSWDFGATTNDNATNSVASFTGTSVTGANFVYYYRQNKAVTMTVASPCVITYSSHTMVAGDQVFFTTNGALPTGVTAGTVYFVKTVLSTSTFTISATNGGTVINSSGSQSGTHRGWPQSAASTLRTVSSGNFVAVSKKCALVQIVQVA